MAQSAFLFSLFLTQQHKEIINCCWVQREKRNQRLCQRSPLFTHILMARSLYFLFLLYVGPLINVCERTLGATRYYAVRLKMSANALRYWAVAAKRWTKSIHFMNQAQCTHYFSFISLFFIHRTAHEVYNYKLSGPENKKKRYKRKVESVCYNAGRAISW